MKIICYSPEKYEIITHLSAQKGMYCYSDGTLKIDATYSAYTTYIYDVTNVKKIKISNACAIATASGTIGNTSVVLQDNIINISVDHDWTTETTGSGIFKSYFTNGNPIISSSYQGSPIDTTIEETYEVNQDDGRNILLVHVKTGNVPVVKKLVE